MGPWSPSRAAGPPGAVLRLLVLLGLALAPARPAAQEALLDSLQVQLRDGRLPAALATARQASEQQGGHAGLWYNLAGLEQQVGDPARARQAFRQAVIHGFDDFRHADRDDDLGALRASPTYAELRAAWADGLAARARARALTLTADRWSDPIALPDRVGGLTPPRAEMRLRVTAQALEVTVEVTGATGLTRAPWHGGGGVFAWLGPPTAAAEGRGGVEMAVGLADNLPAGAVRLGHRWQHLAELTPKLRVLADDVLRYEFAIPWSVCRPWHPLVDRPLLVNLSVTTERDGRAAGHAAWLDDPARGDAGRDWRRGIPVQVDWPPAAGPALHGRVARTLLREEPLEIAPLAAVLPGDGPAEARLVARDREGAVVWRGSMPLPGPAGHRTATLSTPLDLAAGSLRLGATLDGPGVADPVTWETELVSLPPDWSERTAGRIAAAPAAERPALQWRLDAVTAALAGHRPHDPAGALGTTVDELEALLERLQATGSTLPPGGPYLAAAPGPDGEDPLPCSLALPAGWRPGEPATVVLLLARAPGAAERAVTMTPRLLAERAERTDGPVPDLILAYPHLPPRHDPELARARTLHLVRWLGDFLAAGPVHLAGVDLLAATALEVAAAAPGRVAGVLALTGVGFVPYPGATPEELAAVVDGLAADLPVGWYWFPDEQLPDDQAADLRRALRQRGVAVSPARPIAGGLDATQAWTRSVIWAAGLAP